MPRNIAASIENNFINGFVTEATALNFPEAACTDTQNCVFTLKGNVQRRLGLDFEPNAVSDAAVRTGVAVSEFYWRSAGGSGDNNIVVRQLGNILSFFGITSSSLSQSKWAYTLNLDTYLAPGAATTSLAECQFASGRGYLFVAHPNMETVYVSFDPVTQAFASNKITILIRDFDGVPDGLGFDPGYRPDQNQETSQYKYNLYNRGWAPFDPGGVDTLVIPGTIVKGAPYPQAPVPSWIGDPYQTWKSNRTDLPSYSDVWWLYKDSFEQFQPRLASGKSIGNSIAPKGHYILNAFYQDRSAVSYAAAIGPINSSKSTYFFNSDPNDPSIPDLPIVSAGSNRPQTVAFFAGRVFYAGVDATKYSNKVYFSQIIRTEAEFGLCYQKNDPTSEHLMDLLADDGGEISILDCGTILKMVSMQTSLVLFATNGVWAISGSTGIGFTASDFTVRKISSIPTISPSSFVDVAGSPAWWNNDGIYMISGSDAVGQISITSLTEKKIKTYFTTKIPAANKAYARGAFNEVSKVVQWCFKTTNETTVTDRYEFNSILCFNTVTQAFYVWGMPNGPVTLNGIVAVQGKAQTVSQRVVHDNAGNPLTDGGNVPVVVQGASVDATASKFKYLVSWYSIGSIYGLTWAEEIDPTFVDFQTFDNAGTSYDSYIVSGYKVHGDAQKKFQSNYVYLFVDNTTPNGFYFQGLWDYANSPSTGDFGTPQLVTTDNSLADINRNYVAIRRKVRGSGLTLQFKFTSMPGKDFNVVGWSAFESGNASI